MLGLIQERPLLLSDVLTHAALYHANTPVVSRRRDGSFFHSTWSGIEIRVRRLANALRASGEGPESLLGRKYRSSFRTYRSGSHDVVRKLGGINRRATIAGRAH